MFHSKAILKSSQGFMNWVTKYNCHFKNFHSTPGQIIFNSPSFVCVATFCISWHFHGIPVITFVSSPLPYPSVHTSKNYHVTSKQICSIYQFAKVGKTSFFYHYSTYTVTTSHACLLSFNWNIQSEGKLQLNHTATG